MESISLSENFHLCQDSQGNPLEFPSLPAEWSLLAVCLESKRLVRLTIFPDSESWAELQKQSFAERTSMVAGLVGTTTPRVLRWGLVDGMAFYTTLVDVSETLANYLGRTGGLPSSLAVQFVSPLVNTFVELQSTPRLLRGLSLKNLQVVAEDATFLPKRLQITQLGLPSKDRGRALDDGTEDQLARELLHLLYLCLTGQSATSGNGPVPDGLALLGRCPNLLKLVRIAFGYDQGLLTLEAVQAGMAEGERVVGVLNENASISPVLPRLAQLAFGDNWRWPFPKQFQERPAIAGGAGLYSYGAQDVDSKREVWLHPLPGPRLVPKGLVQAVPPSLRGMKSADVPHLLLPSAHWTGDAFDFSVENRLPGVSLLEWLNAGKTASLNEVTRLLRSVQSGLQEAETAGIALPGLHPGNIFLHCLGATAAALPPLADCDVKLRVVANLQTLVEPWYRANPRQCGAGAIGAAFVMLAKELLAHVTDVPAGLRSPVQQWAKAAATGNASAAVPSPADVISSFEANFTKLAPAKPLVTAVKVESVPATPALEIFREVAPTPIAAPPVVPVVHMAAVAPVAAIVEEKSMPAAVEAVEPVLAPLVLPALDVAPFPVQSVLPEKPVEAAPVTFADVLPPLETKVSVKVSDFAPPPTPDLIPTLPEAPVAQFYPAATEDAVEDGVPKLRVDLSRLTTSDSLFTSRSRTITIRNK